MNIPAPDKSAIGEIKVVLQRAANGLLVFRLDISKNLKRFFQEEIFSVRYDDNVDGVPESILYIPALANIAPVAWAIGANVLVKEIDQTFLESLDAVKGVMRRMFKDFSFAGNINAERVVSQQFNYRHSAQLFTGGIDSYSTYIRHVREAPHLISIRTHLHFINPSLQKYLHNRMSDFANKEGVRLHTAESNMLSFLNVSELVNQYGRNFGKSSHGGQELWWTHVQHGLGLLGICAPLSRSFEIGSIYIGSTNTSSMLADPWKPWGSHPFIDNNVSWAGTRVHHDAGELTRQEKLEQIIQPYVKTTGKSLQLIVCDEPGRSQIGNCSQCDKCYRTIAGLALIGIDPTRHGFNVDEDTFQEIKERLEARKPNDPRNNLDVLNDIRAGMWDDIKRRIPTELTFDVMGSRQFFEWLRHQSS